jgi:hypothetical protein
VDKEIDKWLRTGGLKGEPVEIAQELPDGSVTVRKKSGKVVHIPKLFLDLAKARNRGKD